MPASLARRVQPRVGELQRRWDVRMRIARARKLVPHILGSIPPDPAIAHPSTWSVLTATWTLTNVVVIGLGTDKRLLAVLKLPQNPSGLESLRRHTSVLDTLGADARLRDVHSLLPRVIAEGEINQQPFLVEKALPGRELRTIPFNQPAYMTACTAAAAMIGQFHRLTSTTIRIDEATLRRWIDEPVTLIQRLSAVLSSDLGYAGQLDRVAADLRATLLGRDVTVSWIHGDFWPGNVLVASDSTTLTGLIDWDLAAPNELPMHDVLQIVMHTPRLIAHRYELADTVRSLLEGAGWTHDERVLLDAAGARLPIDDTEKRGMLLLYWLRYIATYLSKCPERGSDEAWMKKNIERMLACAM